MWRSTILVCLCLSLLSPRSAAQTESPAQCPSATNPCDQRVSCVLIEGEPQCGRCPEGFEGSGRLDQGGCKDVNECLSSPCDAAAGCTNLDGGFRCNACPPLYEGSGDTDCVRVTTMEVADDGLALHVDHTHDIALAIHRTEQPLLYSLRSTVSAAAIAAAAAQDATDATLQLRSELDGAGVLNGAAAAARTSIEKVAKDALLVAEEDRDELGELRSALGDVSAEATAAAASLDSALDAAAAALSAEAGAAAHSLERVAAAVSAAASEQAAAQSGELSAAAQRTDAVAATVGALEQEVGALEVEVGKRVPLEDHTATAEGLAASISAVQGLTAEARQLAVQGSTEAAAARTQAAAVSAALAQLVAGKLAAMEDRVAALETQLAAHEACAVQGQVLKNGECTGVCPQLAACPETCHAANAGRLSYDAGAASLCDGENFGVLGGSVKLDGLVPTIPAESCVEVKKIFAVSGIYYIGKPGTAVATACDMALSPAKSLGGSGQIESLAGDSCASLKTFFKQPSGKYWIKVGGTTVKVHCDMDTTTAYYDGTDKNFPVEDCKALKLYFGKSSGIYWVKFRDTVGRLYCNTDTGAVTPDGSTKEFYVTACAPLKRDYDKDSGIVWARLNGVTKELYCDVDTNTIIGDGTTAALAAYSCQKIKQGYPDAADGTKYIHVGGNDAFKATCDDGRVRLDLQKSPFSSTAWIISAESRNSAWKCGCPFFDRVVERTGDWRWGVVPSSRDTRQCQAYHTWEYVTGGETVSDSALKRLAVLGRQNKNFNVFLTSCDDDGGAAPAGQWIGFEKTVGGGDYEIVDCTSGNGGGGQPSPTTQTANGAGCCNALQTRTYDTYPFPRKICGSTNTGGGAFLSFSTKTLFVWE